MAAVEIKILLPEHKEELLALEKTRLEQAPGEPFEKEMLSWHANWRPESLDHYLPQGWSFGLWENNQLCAYVLAQPLLFFNGFTQSVWVEHITADQSKSEHVDQLTEVLYKWCRDKHIQKLVVRNGMFFEESLKKIKASPLDLGLLEIKTSKL